MAIVGPSTYVPLSWICKKQTAVSHSTSESEVIAMDAGVRMEGLPGLLLWDLVIEVFEPIGKLPNYKPLQTAGRDVSGQSLYEMFGSVDFVPPSLPITHGRGKLYILEDNDAVIKMTIKDLPMCKK